MTAFLDAEHGGAEETSLPYPARLAMVQTFLGPRTSDNFYQLKVNVESGEIVQKEQLTGCHPHVDVNDMQKTERACLADPQVQAAIKDMKLPEGAIIKIEPWTYATDGMNDMKQKITMVCVWTMDILFGQLHIRTPADPRIIVLFLHATHRPSRRQPLRIPA
jgi:primary-amine oxidase